MELRSVPPGSLKDSAPIFWLSRSDKAEVTLTEGDTGAVLVVSVIDKTDKARVEGLVRIPRDRLEALRVWLDKLLGLEEATK